LDGHSTDANGNIICTDGGRPCLDQWILDNIPTEVTYTGNNNIDYTFYINEGSGKVTDSDGYTVCSSGGQACLDDFVASQIYTIFTYTSGGVEYTYKIYGDGRVTDSHGNVICEEGG